MDGLRPNNHRGGGGKALIESTPDFIKHLRRKGVKFKMRDNRLLYKDSLEILTGEEKYKISESKKIIKAMLFGCDHCVACVYHKEGRYKDQHICSGIPWFYGGLAKSLPIGKCKCPLPKCSESSISYSIGNNVHNVHKSTKALF